MLVVLFHGHCGPTKAMLWLIFLDPFSRPFQAGFCCRENSLPENQMHPNRNLLEKESSILRSNRRYYTVESWNNTVSNPKGTVQIEMWNDTVSNLEAYKYSWSNMVSNSPTNCVSLRNLHLMASCNLVFIFFKWNRTESLPINYPWVFSSQIQTRNCKVVHCSTSGEFESIITTYHPHIQQIHQHQAEQQ